MVAHLMNQASHYVDLLDWLIGPVESVQAYTATLSRNIEVEDSGVMNIRWRSGALGSMNVTMLIYPKNLEGSITVIGEKGTVRVGGVAVNKIEHWEFETAHPDDNLVESSSHTPESVYGAGHEAYYENVIRVLKEGVVAETDGREGLRSLEILIATYLSARDGKRVSPSTQFLKQRMIHSTSIIDAGATIGEGTRIWHWTHVCGQAKIGRNCSLDKTFSWVTM